MTKPELVNMIAGKTGLTKDQASAALGALIDTITGTLKEENKIVIPNLGAFTLKERAARTGRNPRTGETVEIAAKRVPVFKPGKALRDAVDN